MAADVISQGYARYKSGKSLSVWKKRWIVFRRSSSLGPTRIEQYENEDSAQQFLLNGFSAQNQVQVQNQRYRQQQQQQQQQQQNQNRQDGSLIEDLNYRGQNQNGQDLVHGGANVGQVAGGGGGYYIAQDGGGGGVGVGAQQQNNRDNLDNNNDDYHQHNQGQNNLDHHHCQRIINPFNCLSSNNKNDNKNTCIKQPKIFPLTNIYTIERLTNVKYALVIKFNQTNLLNSNSNSNSNQTDHIRSIGSDQSLSQNGGDTTTDIDNDIMQIDNQQQQQQQTVRQQQQQQLTNNNCDDSTNLIIGIKNTKKTTKKCSLATKNNFKNKKLKFAFSSNMEADCWLRLLIQECTPPIPPIVISDEPDLLISGIRKELRERFRVYMMPTTKLEFFGDCLLQVTHENIYLWDITQTDCKQKIAFWPLTALRRYGSDQNKFTFEAGRHCMTGEGRFDFHTFEGEKIYRKVHQATLTIAHVKTKTINDSAKQMSLSSSSSQQQQQQQQQQSTLKIR